MNNNSLLCKFISEHPRDFEKLLTENYFIKVKRDGAYAIFVYDIGCDFSLPLVQEARGIIIDVEHLEVVCWPFRKFGNHNESYADKIDWSTARVLEKVDGSIIKLWYDKRAGAWQFSTNGTIRAELATIDAYPGVKFGDIIKRADNFSDIKTDTLDKDKTYIFELVSPETRVVIKYDTTTLYHIGTRHNVTGVETEEDIGIKKPASYPLTSLADCLKAATVLNKSADGGSEEVEWEGFVVVDAKWQRVKIKSPDYLVQHRLASITAPSKRDCLTLLLTDRDKAERLMAANPATVPYFKFYEYKLAELAHTADKLAIIARSLFDEYSGDRAAVAKIILRHRLSAIAFRALECTESGSEILLSIPVEKLQKFIPNYEPEDLSKLFTVEDDT